MRNRARLHVLGYNPIFPWTSLPTQDATASTPIRPDAINDCSTRDMRGKDLLHVVLGLKQIGVDAICSWPYSESTNLKVNTNESSCASWTLSRFTLGPKDSKELGQDERKSLIARANLAYRRRPCRKRDGVVGHNNLHIAAYHDLIASKPAVGLLVACRQKKPGSPPPLSDPLG